MPRAEPKEGRSCDWEYRSDPGGEEGPIDPLPLLLAVLTGLLDRVDDFFDPGGLFGLTFCISKCPKYETLAPARLPPGTCEE